MSDVIWQGLVHARMRDKEKPLLPTAVMVGEKAIEFCPLFR